MKGNGHDKRIKIRTQKNRFQQKTWTAWEEMREERNDMVNRLCQELSLVNVFGDLSQPWRAEKVLRASQEMCLSQGNRLVAYSGSGGTPTDVAISY